MGVSNGAVSIPYTILTFTLPPPLLPLLYSRRTIANLKSVKARSMFYPHTRQRAAQNQR